MKPMTKKKPNTRYKEECWPHRARTHEGEKETKDENNNETNN